MNIYLLCAILTLVIVAGAVPTLIGRFVCRKVGHAWVAAFIQAYVESVAA